MIADTLTVLTYAITAVFCLAALAWGVGLFEPQPKHRGQRRPVRAMFLERGDQPTEAETERIVQAVAAEAAKGDT